LLLIAVYSFVCSAVGVICDTRYESAIWPLHSEVEVLRDLIMLTAGGKWRGHRG